MRLRVNPIRCTGHGVCAELLPEIIRLDPWGYPVLDEAAADLPRHLAEHARRAAAACPVLALALTRPGRPLLVLGGPYSSWPVRVDATGTPPWHVITMVTVRKLALKLTRAAAAGPRFTSSTS